MLSYWTAGNRSSVDASNVGGNEEDETVVEPEQGNGKRFLLCVDFIDYGCED